MRKALYFLIGAILVGAGMSAAAEDTRRAAPLGTSPLVEPSAKADAVSRPHGLPANQWRYRFYAGRWWYWTAGHRWSYFDGNRWRMYAERTAFDRRPVDPALLRLEAKEGVLGRKRWPVTGGFGAGGAARGGSGGGASLPISGTQGSIGGAPTGSFTYPSGVPSAIGTSTGIPGGVWLPGAGRATAGNGLGMGGGGTGRGR